MPKLEIQSRDARDKLLLSLDEEYLRSYHIYLLKCTDRGAWRVFAKT